MKRWLKLSLGICAVIALVTAYSTETKATAVAASSSKYIEVCRNGVVYVPPGTKYVTCNGKVMRVLAIVPLEEGQAQTAGNCYCPDCCGGGCAVIVTCQSEPETATAADDCRCGANRARAGGGGLCTIYLACGD